jgi:hypothetical protein
MRKNKTQNKRQKQGKITENNISVKRNIIFVLGFIVLLGMNAFLIYRGNKNLDDQLVIYYINSIFYGMMVYTLLFERRNGYEIYRSTSYRRWFLLQILQFVIVIFTIYSKTPLPIFVLNGFLIVPSQGALASIITIVLDIFLIHTYSLCDSSYLIYIMIQGLLGLIFAYLFKEKIRRREKNVSLVLSFLAVIGIFFTLKVYVDYHKLSLVSIVSILIGLIIYTMIIKR